MMGLIIAIHVLACILLIIIILIQAGRGGGLVEGFSNVESMFGPKTNTFLTRTTTVFSVIFFITCLTLALLSARQSRSLMRDIQITEPKTSTSATTTVTTPTAKEVSQASATATTSTVNEAAKPAPQEAAKTINEPAKAQ